MSQETRNKRFLKKASQIVMLLAAEKATGKIDWHSRDHLASDLQAVAKAAKADEKAGK